MANFRIEMISSSGFRSDADAMAQLALPPAADGRYDDARNALFTEAKLAADIGHGSPTHVAGISTRAGAGTTEVQSRTGAWPSTLLHQQTSIKAIVHRCEDGTLRAGLEYLSDQFRRRLHRLTARLSRRTPSRTP